MEKNINKNTEGLHVDNSLVDQPKGTTRFVLNGVNETKEGDSHFISNERSNEPCYEIPKGYVLLGDVYTTDNKIVVFSVSSDNSLSEIGIVDDSCNYKTLVNANLGFRVDKQIDATYRLRRGCERMVYFVTPKPMLFNLDKPEDFQDGNGDWDPSKFTLFKTYDKIPNFERIEIEENGNLPAGSYNAAIQYLDSDLNPTEWITTSEPVIIYNDNLSKNYREIRGSSSEETTYQNFGNTNKSIKFTFSNLDEEYPFYRIAIIEANNGTGIVNGVKISQEISTEVNVFNYTGSASVQTEGTEEEIQAFNNIIEEAQHIEQIENRLTLHNVKGKQINYCKLQSYASRIKSDLTTKEVILNQLVTDNPKNGTVHFTSSDIDGIGYMPGEIYSFGIVYVFADGSVSPVYHIPGKAEGFFSRMRDDNKCTDTFYTDNNSCEDYWGVDSEGDPLLNQPVRHHKFPLRSEVQEPLYTEGSELENIVLKQLKLDISGTINSNYTEEFINYTVEYEIDGNISFYEGSINVSTFDPNNPLSITLTTSSSNIQVNALYENNTQVVGVPNSGTSSNGLTYATSVVDADLNIEDKIYKSNIFGIRFSGIELPSTDDTNGAEVVGYYIVRNERDEDNKSILDTGVMTPMLDETTDSGYFVAHGHIIPELPDEGKIKSDVFGIIHPEHRFGNKEYRNTSQIIKEGEFRTVGSPTLSSVRTQDVMAGTSYDSDRAKRRERDSDGFSLHTLTRDNQVAYKRSSKVLIDKPELTELFYLDALNSKVITDVNDQRKEIFNVSGDNKIAAVQSSEELDKSEVFGKLPYVVMKRDLSNPYGNFRILPYYKESKNFHRFIKDEQGNVLPSSTEASIFNGDVYITPMRYHSSVFYDVRLRKRASKSGLLNTIIGALSVIAGVVLIATGVGVAAGIAAIGFGVSQIATGIKKDQIAKVYSELYDAGLRNAVDDTTTDLYFGPNPPDDEIQWLGDVVTNLWFESTANMAVRKGATVNITDFLDAPAPKATPGNSSVQVVNLPWGGTYTVVSASDSPQNELDSYLIEKLTVLDTENSNGRLYQGYSNAEIYEINPDYRRRNKQKIFYHLGIEYDCCSDCLEDFPHRSHFSEQSFQEELTDNYRVFLPNNYRDIEGEKGTIKNVFRIKNNLFIHTEEALWHLPQNIQERITGDIVSFIGTGSFFSIPPRLISDTDTSSGGTQHKWSMIKSTHGVFFVSENEGKIYQFDGNQIIPISDFGMESYFRKNIPLLLDQDYESTNSRPYPYRDNPSNNLGTGFISTYDSENERVIFTKRDLILSDDITQNTDYEICAEGGNVTIFNNYQQTINQYQANGFDFVGIEGCRMKFSRTVFEERVEEREVITQVPNEADIHIFYDTSGSFDVFIQGSRPLNPGENLGPSLGQIDQAVDDWLVNFSASNPDWNGNLYKYIDSSERWLTYAQIIGSTTYSGQNTANKDIIVVSFCNESDNIYHGNFSTPIPNPTSTYIGDYNSFVGGIFNSYNSFVGIHYPIVFDNLSSSKQFVLHSLAALKGTEYTSSEVNQIEVNPAFSISEWNSLKTALVTNNPYPDNGLEQFGWLIKPNRFKDNGVIITSDQFQEDVDTLLEGVTTTELVNVTVQVPVTEFEYVEGEPVEDPVKFDKSWTMSYSLKKKRWTSWHSYLPNYYLTAVESFYSWLNGDKTIWKHNVDNSYQNFYGNRYAHILEYVSLSNPLITRVWDEIRLNTHASVFEDQYREMRDVRFTTFNKMIAYNSRQSTGLINLFPKNSTGDQYLDTQVQSQGNDTILIDRNERDWTINDFRDVVVNYNTPLFRKDDVSLESEYFIDKVVNQDSVDYNKHWSQLESFRDKYLVIRLIFDNFDNVKLVTNYSVESESQSLR